MTGFVSFVGAGPGDPELMTLKGADRMRRADVILFDDLSAGPLLTHARQSAELIAVGKRAGRTSPKQDEVSQLLVQHASSGARVVRLKSGDGGLFGRLEEELVALRTAKLTYEIIPGIPSAFAAAAAAGIPLTRAMTARRVQFVTGHDQTGALPEDLYMPALADPRATTIVFMGKRTFPLLVTALIKHGLARDTPALLAEAVSTPQQFLQRSTIAALSEKLSQTIGNAPALILYGPLAETADV